MKNFYFGIAALILIYCGGIFTEDYFPWTLIPMVIGGGLIGQMSASADSYEELKKFRRY